MQYFHKYGENVVTLTKPAGLRQFIEQEERFMLDLETQILRLAEDYSEEVHWPVTVFMAQDSGDEWYICQVMSSRQMRGASAVVTSVSEEYLNGLSKEDLMKFCDEYKISYKHYECADCGVPWNPTGDVIHRCSKCGSQKVHVETKFDTEKIRASFMAKQRLKQAGRSLSW
jgi:DNA-directed RNA polymerase subunit RPC12/RpoP